MKPALALAFGLSFGAGGYALVDSAPYTVAAPVASPEQMVLSAPAAARFVPLVVEHIPEISISLRGQVSAEDPAVFFPVTVARYAVPSLRAGGAPLTGEHRSLTNSDAMPGIVGLVEQVVLPSMVALCPDLSDRDAYPEPTVAHVQAAGIEARGGEVFVTGNAEVPALLEGLPAVRCRIPVGAVPAPPGAVGAVTAMVAGYVVPAIKAERGLR